MSIRMIAIRFVDDLILIKIPKSSIVIFVKRLCLKIVGMRCN